ncbi:methionine synthase [Pseudohalioglobus lutimaris]|nr:methionine synthase [Pseudohalioglobus lutimaris]
MSDDLHENDAGDGTADAIAATAVISLVVLTLYIWLSGMPS